MPPRHLEVLAEFLGANFYHNKLLLTKIRLRRAFCAKVIANSFEVLSIQLMTILQAIDYLGCQEKLAPHTLSLYTQLRKIFPKFIEDAPKYNELKKVATFLQVNDPAVSSKIKAL